MSASPQFVLRADCADADEPAQAMDELVEAIEARAAPRPLAQELARETS